MKTLVAITLLAVSAAPFTDTPDIPRPARLPQHDWLQQLVGEWSVTVEATMEPGAEPMKLESTESVRSIGGLWIVAEGTEKVVAESTDGHTPFTSILTVGYDPAKESFVGTWIDTAQSHMWIYRGELDDGGTTLTLESEGPAFDGSERTTTYHDVIEVVSPDHRVLRSSMQGADGTWTSFMRADYHRRRSP